MSEQIRAVAARIRDLREISGKSINELSKELGIKEETYNEYESGNSDIPVSFLYVIAQKFNVELSAILTGDSPKLHTYSLVRNGTGISVERRKQYKYKSLAYNFIHKKAEPFLVTVEPELDESKLDFNSHPGQEFNYVLEGVLKVIIDNKEIILHEGDSLFFDSNAKHAMKAQDQKPPKFIAVIF